MAFDPEIFLPDRKITRVADIIERITGSKSGPSAMGWSKIQLPMKCWRKAYHVLVQDLRKVCNEVALDTGTLFHYVLNELLYRNVSVQDARDFIREVGKEAPMSAETVHKLLFERDQKGKIFVEDTLPKDLDKWNILFTEEEAGFELDNQKVHPIQYGRLDPVTVKYDLVRKEDDGVVVVETKTTSAFTRDLTFGFTMDGQLLLNKLVWNRSGLRDKYGPLKYFTLNIFVKTKVPQHERFTVEITDEQAENFWSEVKPWVEQLHRQLAATNKDEIHKWPRNIASCKDRFGLCKYFELCLMGENARDLYEVRAR